MNRPWKITAGGQIELVKPDVWLFPAGAWNDVEEALGTNLPADYKDLIGDGFACIFDEELFISSPFDPNPGLNLLLTAAATAFSLAYVRADYPEAYPYPIYPEPGGLLGSGDGWRRRPVPLGHRHAGSRYLDRCGERPAGLRTLRPGSGRRSEVVPVRACQRRDPRGRSWRLAIAQRLDQASGIVVTR